MEYTHTGGRFPRKKILLADGSRTLLFLHQLMFQDTEYELLTARNGAEAVELAVAECPDAIFLDVVMPLMNGFQACAALRARPETRSIPIFMVTTRGEPVNVEAGYQAGCDEFVTKPFDRVELMSRLRTLLGE